MLCYVVLCYAMLCYVMLCYVLLCYALFCSVMLCCVVLFCVMLCYVMLCYVVLCYVMLCYVMLCYAMLRCVTCYVLCAIWLYVMLCYAVLCYFMLCYVILDAIDRAEYEIGRTPHVSCCIVRFLCYVTHDADLSLETRALGKGWRFDLWQTPRQVAEDDRAWAGQPRNGHIVGSDICEDPRVELPIRLSPWFCAFSAARNKLAASLAYCKAGHQHHLADQKIALGRSDAEWSSLHGCRAAQLPFLVSMKDEVTPLRLDEESLRRP